MVHIPIPYRPDAGPAEPSPQPAPYGPEDHAADQDAAKRADVALVSQVNPLLDDPGADPDQVLHKLAQAHEAAAQGLRPSARAMFEVVAGQRLAGWRQDISAQAQRRQAAAVAAISEARQQAAAGEFARHALDDPERASADLLTVSSEAHTRAERQGPDPQAAARAGAQARGEAVVGAVKGALARDPQTALRLFDSHRELIDPQSADVLHPLIRQETERQARSRRIDDLIAAARPSLPRGLGDLLPPDAHPPLDPEAIIAEAMAHAGDDPDRRRAMALDVHARVAQLNAQRASACRAAAAKGQDCLADPNIASLDDLPADLRLTLPASTRQGLETFYASGGHPPVSDPQAYAGLHAAMLADPAAFNEIDLTPYAAHLDKADFARLRSDQQTLRQGGPPARAIRDGIGQVTAKATSALAEIGITATTDPARLAQVTASALTAAQDARDAQDGKPLTEQQADQAVDKAVMGNDGYLIAANGLWLPPGRDAEVEQQALKALAARSHEFGVAYDPAMRTLGHYTFNRDGSLTFTPMDEDEIQLFKERTLDSDSYRPGLKSPEELALDREVELRMRKEPQNLDTPQVAALLAAISAGEGTDDATAQQHQYASGYDAVYYGGLRPPKPLTQMTLGEVMAFQVKMKANPANHKAAVVGKYQFTPTKLTELKEQHHISDDEKFDPQLQERMARYVLKQRYAPDYINGKIDLYDFQKQLAREWDSIEEPGTGLTHSKHKPRTASQQIQPLIRELEGKSDR